MKRWIKIIGVVAFLLIVGFLAWPAVPKTTLGYVVEATNKTVPGESLLLTYESENGQSTWVRISGGDSEAPDAGEIVFGVPGGKLYLTGPDGKKHLVNTYPKGTHEIRFPLKWYIQGKDGIFENLAGIEKSDTGHVILKKSYKLSE